MQETRRLAKPSRVHQLWNGISDNGSNQVVDVKKLMYAIRSKYRIPLYELHRELNFAIDDGLILKEVVETQDGEKTEIYKLPDATTVEKGEHDWYCFKCHVGGSVPVVKCKDCPRVYHLKCIPKDRKPENDLFVCPACHIMSTKPSAEKVVVTPKVLNELLQFIIDRIKTWKVEIFEKADGKTWALAANRTDQEAWSFPLLVHMPMDLQTMTSKATQAKYTSLEEFQIDCETLAHAITVYFGVEMLKNRQIVKSFTRETVYDLQQIKLCHDCFRRSNEKNHEWWFCLPCSTPHEVVWAKQKGCPYWPAKVMKKYGNFYDIRYFGGNYELGFVEAKNIQPIETSISQLNIRQTQAWNDAFEELRKFQELAKDPELAQKLPPKGGRGASSATKVTGGGNKRGATQRPEEVVTKKSRKSEPVTSKSSQESGPSSKKATLLQANGTATTPSSTIGRENVVIPLNSAKPSLASAPPKRDSASGSSSIPVTGIPSIPTKPVKITLASNEKNKVYRDALSTNHLEPDVIAFLNEVAKNESLEGEACFSDEESNELQEKVTENVSSSCNESKPTQNVYVQVGCQGLLREKLIKKFTDLQERHKLELCKTKMTQWCVYCKREAIYPCCWNVSYCSKDCQRAHWIAQHRRECCRKNPA